MTTGEDNLHRVRVEGHQDRRDPARPARLHRTADQLLVATVDTVEYADRDDTSTPVGGDFILPPPALHVDSLRPVRNARPSAPPDQASSV